MTMSDDHPTGYVDLTKPNADAASSTPEPSAPEPPAPTQAAPAPTEEADVLAGSPPAAPTPTPAQMQAKAQAQAAQQTRAQAQTAQAAGTRPSFMNEMPDLRETTDDDPATVKSREEFTTVYDIIDQLEAALGEAKSSIFAPGMVKVDRDEFTDQLSELKKMLPVQLERASALMREAERRLESAQTQSNAIVASAQSRAADMIKDANEQAQFLAGQENVTELARQKARAILDQAQTRADHLTQGADQYCTTVMKGLSQQLGKLSRDVQAGLNVLEERQRAAGEQMPHLTLNDYPEAQ